MAYEVQCKCGNWIEVPEPGKIRSCWKCNAQVKYEGQQGKVMPFMVWEWQSAPARQVSGDQPKKQKGMRRW